MRGYELNLDPVSLVGLGSLPSTTAFQSQMQSYMPFSQVRDLAFQLLCRRLRQLSRRAITDLFARLRPKLPNHVKGKSEAAAK